MNLTLHQLALKIIVIFLKVDSKLFQIMQSLVLLMNQLFIRPAIDDFNRLGVSLDTVG